MINKLAMRFIIVFLSMITFAQSESIFGKKDDNKIGYFALNTFMTVHEHKDSVNVHAYLSIPFTTLQFLKSDSGYFAIFEATVTIKDKQSGDQLNRRTWKDSIIVDEYIQTTNKKMFRVLYTSFIAVSEAYAVLGEVVDLETQFTGDTEIEVDATEYSDPLVLFPVIIIDSNDNELNMIDGWHPQLSRYQLFGNEGLKIYVCGRISPGNYTIQLDIQTLENNQLWSNRYEFFDTTNTFGQIIAIPDSAFSGFKVNLNTILTQENKIIEKQKIISLLKPGVSSQITDINSALDQMNYILTEDEKKLVKKGKAKDREKLFMSLWEKRDPTPYTQINELMNEFYERVHYTNVHFSDFQPGWQTDQGMIYILFGKPDTIDRSVSQDRRTVYEVWIYYLINKQFVFKDSNGFGDFRLETPYFLHPN